MSKRDDFTEATKLILAQRVNYICANPNCSIITVGPHTQIDKSLKIGMAAHITAAAKGGPRYDETLSSVERKHLSNGIWTCENCGKLIDADDSKHSVELLQEWKLKAEEEASKVIGKTKSADVYSNESIKIRDRDTFNKITEDLLPSYLIDFMRNQSFSSSYSYESIKPFFDYRAHKSNSKLRFTNSILENIKVNLFDNIISLIDDIIDVNTFLPNGSVVLPHSNFKNDRKKINIVHRYAANICKYYDDLVEKAYSFGL